MGPADPILGLNDMFNKDTTADKISLGVGAYRTDEGKPLVLDSVLAAEKKIVDGGLNKEYAGISGLPDFCKLSCQFAYGDSSAPLAENRVAAVQTLSGTGACRLIGEFYSKFLGKGTAMYLPKPTWGNHHAIMKDAGMTVKEYTYYDGKGGLDFNGLIADLNAAPNGSVFLLHACAHNPTGVDPTMEQWGEISAAFKAKGHIPFFDSAYQGFASGDADYDAGAVRKFVDDGHCIALAQSFAKNFGLYGERVGCLSVVCNDPDEAARVESQLKILIRPMYSNPPIHGARIVATILSDDTLKPQWYAECKAMADRILSMRQLLKDELATAGSTKNWSHITDQVSGLQVQHLTQIYTNY
jgi:aspartate aminotransferase